MRTSAVLLLSGLAAQQVSATWNRNANYFNSPQYNNNECSDKQKGGFNWSDLPEGSFSGYGDFGFGGGEGGWKCSNSFGKRDGLTKRTFNSKCITNKVKKDTPASFNCDKKKDGFSVKEIDVSVEYDTELEFHYKMPDGNTCKQKASCKKEGSTVYNTQCGGATSVDVYLGDNNNKDKSDCEIGFHRIDFDCSPPTEYTPPPPPSYETPSAPPSSASKPVETPTPPPGYSSPPETPSETPSSPVYTPPSSAPSPPPVYGNSSVPTPPPAESTPPPSYETTPVSPPGESTPVPPPSYESSSAVPPPSGETSEVPPPSYESSTAVPPPSGETYTPVPPPSGETYTPVSPPSGETSTPVPPSYESTSAKPEQPPASSSTPQPSNYPPPPAGGYSPPECLPKCMNTWLQINSKCKDNTDADCYCKNPDFTKSVIECVSAWAKDDNETQQALQYLLGICAPAVPENPGIITNCPSNIPLNPAPTPAPEAPASSGAIPTGPAPSAPAPSAPAPSAPGAAPPAPTYPVTTITYSSSTYTVPQVHFTTETPGAPGVNPSEPVALVPGTPAPVPAQTTGAPAPPYPVPTSLATATIPGSTGLVPTAPPAQFTGAASSFSVEAKHAFLGAALAFFAL